jgi:hypothetical protein
MNDPWLKNPFLGLFPSGIQNGAYGFGSDFKIEF